MPRYAQLHENNVAIGCSNLSGEVDATHMILIRDDDDYTGWTYTDGEWFPPPPPPASSTFPTLTRKQLRNGLLSIGVTSADVEAHIAAIADPLDREAAMIDWQDTQTYERTYPLVDQIAAAMSLPPEQVDALWAWSAGQ